MIKQKENMTIRFYEDYKGIYKTDVIVLSDERQINDLLLILDTYGDFKDDEVGRFLFRDYVSGLWIAIDNTTNDVWIEHYETLEKALSYLLVDEDFKLTETDNNMMSQTIDEYYTGNIQGDMIYFYN